MDDRGSIANTLRDARASLAEPARPSTPGDQGRRALFDGSEYSLRPQTASGEAVSRRPRPAKHGGASNALQLAAQAQARHASSGGSRKPSSRSSASPPREAQNAEMWSATAALEDESTHPTLSLSADAQETDVGGPALDDALGLLDAALAIEPAPPLPELEAALSGLWLPL